MGKTVVLDNGGGTIKVCVIPSKASSRSSSPKSKRRASAEACTPLVIPNALARAGKAALSIPPNLLGESARPAGLLVGAEILRAPDYNGMQLKRPHDRGFVSTWDTQRDIWQSLLFERAPLGIGLRELAHATLLLTEAIGAPMRVRTATDELVFEQFGFGALSVAPPQRLAAARARRRTALVLDTGFSFTHAVPIINGWEMSACARRLNVGGKLLTNQLKTTISFRSWNMMDETWVMNAVKERLCYVSTRYEEELALTKRKDSAARKEYILPDMSRIGADPLGHVRIDAEELDGSEQVLIMNNERISVPELLFYPSDVGIDQGGIAELIFESVQAVPEEYRAELYANIVLVGGNCNFPNFSDRLMAELRPLVCSTYDVNIWMDDDPVLTTVLGGVRAMTEERSMPYQLITKAQYEEEGSSFIASKFFAPDVP